MLSVPFNNMRTHTDHHNIVGLSSQLECLGPVSQYLVISHNNSEVSTTVLQKPATNHPTKKKAEADCHYIKLLKYRHKSTEWKYEKSNGNLNSFLLTSILIWIYVTFDWLLAQNIDTFRSIIIKRSDHSVVFMFSVVFHINCPNFFSPSVLTDWSESQFMSILIDI